MRDYRKLEVWSKAHALCLDVYRATRAFPEDEKYGLTSQLRRASVSIPANIAEGCGPDSRATFARYLQIAAGSASELDYLILLSTDLGMLRAPDLASLITEVRKMLTAFIVRLRAKS